MEYETVGEVRPIARRLLTRARIFPPTAPAQPALALVRSRGLPVCLCCFEQAQARAPRSAPVSEGKILAA